MLRLRPSLALVTFVCATAIPHLARAAAAVGIDALFMEVHPEPEEGLSDSATMFPLGELRNLLLQIQQIDSVIRGIQHPIR